MRHTHSIKNEHSDELEVWVEPWGSAYTVPRGATLTLHFDASSEAAARLHTEVSQERVTLWFNYDYEPDAELNGEPVEPVWQ